MADVTKIRARGTLNEYEPEGKHKDTLYSVEDSNTVLYNGQDLTSGSGGDIDLSNIEATKLKTPVKIWGQEFDGSKDIKGPLRTSEIGTAEDGGVLMRFHSEDRLLEIGEEANKIYIYHDIESDSNISTKNITEIESKLEGVTKAAEDSEVVKTILISGNNSELNETIFPDARNSEIGIDFGTGLFVEGGEIFNSNSTFRVSADTDYLATKESVDILRDEVRNNKIPIINQTETEVTIKPNVFNKWEEVESLTINFEEGSEEYLSEYMIQFISGETPTVLSLPADIKFPIDMEIEPNRLYQISIVNNFGIYSSIEL